MLAFLNQVRKPTLDLPSKCGAKCGSNRSCNPTWWSFRLPDDVPDSQEL